MNAVWKDFKFGARMLAGHPGMATAAMLTLALGICAVSTILSWINGTILDPIPGVRGTRSLVTVDVGERSDNPVPPLSYLDFLDFRQGVRGRAFTDVLAYHDEWIAVTDSAKPERRYGALVSANYFSLLDVPMTLGRGFGAAEESAGPGGAPVVVIGHGLWRTRFSKAKNVVGRTIQVNRQPYTIVGVAPEGFQGCKTGMRVELWIPFAMDREVWGSRRMTRRDTKWLNVTGRLAPGVSRDQATAAAGSVMRGLAKRYPDDHEGPVQVTLDPLWRSPYGVNVYMYSTLPFLLGIAAVVLLLACANVANLMLVRSVARRRELAIRLAMGAGRWQLVRQGLVESGLIALGGAGLAVVGTAWTADLFQSFLPPMNNPVVLTGRLDAVIVFATVGVGLASSLAAGILPALRSTSVAPVEVLNEETGRASGGIHKARLTRALVVAQVALSLLLLVFAGLFVRSLNNAEQAHPGFDADGVLLASFNLDAGGYNTKAGIAFQREVMGRLRAQPGVRDVAFADWVPLTFSKRTSPVEISGYTRRDDEVLDLRRATVSPGYFEAMRVPVLTGREFTLLDTLESEQVAMVDDTFAARYWPGQEALGQRIRVGTSTTWRTVVGVVRATRHQRVNETVEPMYYLPAFQDYRTELVIHTRVLGDPASFGPVVRRTMWDLNPDLPVYDIMTLRSAMRLATILERVGGTFVGTFGLVALLLAAIGIYGVLSYTARQRTRELGIRMALGARRWEVFKLVVADGLRLTAMGLAVGMAAALTLSRVARGMLYGVAEMDAVTYAVVACVLSLVAFGACAIPALRAAHVQPLDALRTE